MQIYTELNLGKTDPGLREPDVTFDITKATEKARLIESLGFDGVVSTETKDDSYIMMALAAEATTTLQVATSVAIAFARAPYTTAMAAWRLQALSRGRFTLGLGPQVKAHIVRRFGIPFTPAGPWMRDYIGAVRAFWDCWQNGTKLNYESDRYKLNLMVPLFDPAAADPYCCGQHLHGSGRRRGGRRSAPASDVHAALHPRGSHAVVQQGRGHHRARHERHRDCDEAAGGDRSR